MNSAIHISMKRKSNVNASFFTDCNTPESAYLLGLLWADGSVGKDNNLIAIECSTYDLSAIKPVFDKSGEWLDSYRFRKGRKPQMTLRCSCKGLADLFKANETSMNLLNTIPDQLKPYFIQGLFDGDGCIYLNPKYSTFQVAISSNFNENWDIQNYLKSKGIMMIGIQKVLNKNSYSCMRITNKGDCIRFYDLIYQGKSPLGLIRKWVKLNSVKYPQ